MTRAEYLQTAEKCINGDRDMQYGSPERSFTTISEYWNEFLGDRLNERITDRDVGIMMALFKIARMTTYKDKADNYIDAIGYLACAGEIRDAEDENY